MDEFYEYGSGMKLYSTGHISKSFFNHGIVNPIIVEISSYLAGKDQSFFISRLFQLFMGGLSVSLIFYFALRFYSYSVAFFISAFFIVSPYFNISTHRILADNPALLAFILVLICFEKFLSSKNIKFLILAGIFFSISIASKLYIVAYYPFFFFLSFKNEKQDTNFKKIFSLILWIVYLFFLTYRLKLWPIYAFISFTLAIITIIIICKSDNIYSCFKECFLNRDAWRKGAVFTLSLLISLFIIFPQIVIYFQDSSEQFLSMEVFKDNMTVGGMEFSPGMFNLPLSGYSYYFVRLYKLGLSPLIVFLLIPAFITLSVVFYKGTDCSRNGKAYELILLPALYGFLIIGIWKVWYLRYMLHLFPLFSALSIVLLFTIVNYLSQLLRNKFRKNRIVSYLPNGILAVLLVFFLFTGFQLSGTINNVRSIDNGFFLMAESLAENSVVGDKIGFTYWQAFSLESNLFHKPYGSYAMMMYPFKDNVAFEKINESEAEYKKVDMIVTTMPLNENYKLISKTSSMNRLLKEFDSLLPQSLSKEENEKMIHYFLREGGGYPQTFWIYRQKEENILNTD